MSLLVAYQNLLFKNIQEEVSLCHLDFDYQEKYVDVLC